jgi:hypothetical protein
VAAERLGLLGLREDLLEQLGPVLHLVEAHNLQRDRLLGFAIERLMNGGKRRLSYLTDEFKPADLFRHLFDRPKPVVRETAWVNDNFGRGWAGNYESTQEL